MAVKIKVKSRKGLGRVSKIKQRAYISNEALREKARADSLATQNKQLLKTIDSLKVELQI